MAITTMRRDATEPGTAIVHANDGGRAGDCRWIGCDGAAPERVLGTIIPTVMLTWFVMRAPTRLLSRWLYPRARP